MIEVARDRSKLLNRVRRMRGQMSALERAVRAKRESLDVLQQATACRGALDGFIAEVIEEHIREHLVRPNDAGRDGRELATEGLIDIVHQFLRK
jgi:FrmR/RcnR family transcriptional regulator, repressor of frmRAB operon